MTYFSNNLLYIENKVEYHLFKKNFKALLLSFLVSGIVYGLSDFFYETYALLSGHPCTPALGSFLYLLVFSISCCEVLGGPFQFEKCSFQLCEIFLFFFSPLHLLALSRAHGFFKITFLLLYQLFFCLFRVHYHIPVSLNI